MPRTEFYRYIHHKKEVEQILKKRMIKSTNPKPSGTWFSPNRYDDKDEAMEKLSLPKVPTHRIGPISNSKMPDFDIVYLRSVAPANGNPGGGIEACTSGIVWLLGFYDFENDKFEF